MNKLSVLDLFSGIGGFSLGLERTGGFETVQFCEIDSFCRKILAKHWPDVPCHDDITTMRFEEGQADVITGGFPCQDISLAGAGAGLAGERSGLWRELHRAIRLVQPRYAIIENVAALLSRGLGEVLTDIAEIGYDAEWHCIPASAVGAPHRRDRIWIVAYPQRSERRPHHDGRGSIKQGQNGGREKKAGGARECREVLAYPNGERLEGKWPYFDPERWQEPRLGQVGLRNGAGGGQGQWEVEPSVGRVAYGISNRVDRLRGLGNAVVPQIPELIGNAILDYERELAA